MRLLRRLVAMCTADYAAWEMLLRCPWPGKHRDAEPPSAIYQRVERWQSLLPLECVPPSKQLRTSVPIRLTTLGAG
jgi:hypothetical protein